MARPKILSDDEVLTQAFAVISRQGFDSFTLEQVAKKTGLSPAALLKRFKSKRNLALRSRNAAWTKICSESEARQESSARGLEGLRRFIKEIASSVDTERLGEHAKLLGEDASHPRLRQEAARYFQWTRDLIEKFLEEAEEDGELRPLPNRKKFAMHLEALTQGTIFQFAFLRERNIETRLREEIQLALEPYSCMPSIGCARSK